MLSAEERLDKLHEFYNFPFLNNESFIAHLKKLTSAYKVTPANLQSFILKAQVAFYISLIDPSFDASVLRSITKAKESKCPFASKLAQNPEIPIANVNLLADLNDDVFCIDSPSGVSIEMHYAKQVENAIFNERKDIIYVIPSDSKFMNPKLVSDSQNKSILHEIFKTKQVITSSDLRFLLPESVLVIERSDINLFLNLRAYFEIFKIEESLENFKSAGISSKHLPPSQLEPYADLLTIEYIRSNPDFFK